MIKIMFARHCNFWQLAHLGLWACGSFQVVASDELRASDPDTWMLLSILRVPQICTVRGQKGDIFVMV